MKTEDFDKKFDENREDIVDDLVKKMKTPDDIKGRFHSEIYWRGVFDLKKAIQEQDE